MTHKEFFEYIEKQCNKILTKEEKDAVIYNEGNHCIQNTAGSGKITVICCKIAYFILVKGLTLSEISVVSFSKFSASDLNLTKLYELAKKLEVLVDKDEIKPRSKLSGLF